MKALAFVLIVADASQALAQSKEQLTEIIRESAFEHGKFEQKMWVYLCGKCRIVDRGGDAPGNKRKHK